MCERTGFNNFMKVVEPRYKIPSNQYMSTSWLDFNYQQSVDAFKLFLSKNCDILSLTSDIWSSRSQDSYIGITAHFIDNNFTRHELTLNCTPFNNYHTGQLIAEKFTSALNFWNIDKSNIHVVLTDAAANIKLGCQLASLKNQTCAPHDLHNIIKNVVFDQEEINSTIEKIKSLVTYYHKSNIAANKLD